jgi:prevent-host-death family protein
MCYRRGMERIGIRELRNHASRVVRRARAGERIVITVDGVPAAQVVPLDAVLVERSIDDLVAAGLVLAPRTSVRHEVRPIRVPGPRTSTEVLEELRER